MSLRVLLADESDTIKKVFQLALQDLNAEIKSVQSGLDVLDVAQTFNPDIIFADVLLQKKNGYETCREFKQDPVLGSTPVVLMWSSFMELDQDQYKKSKADDQLEKPFDADFLRELIKKYVPQTQENPLGQFLNFPKSIATEPEAKPFRPSAPIQPPPLPLTESSDDEDTSEFNISHFLDDSLQGASGAQPPLGNEPLPSLEPAAGTGDESWLSADLSKFKIDLESPSDNLEKFEALNLGEKVGDRAGEKQTDKQKDSEDLALSSLSKVSAEKLDALFDFEPKSKSSPTIPPPPTAEAPPERDTNPSMASRIQAQKTSTLTQTRHRISTTGHPDANIGNVTGLSADDIEAIVRAHTEEVIKNQITDNIHSIIEKIVREELERVMDEEVRLKQDMGSDNR